MKLTWFGHSCVLLSGTKKVLIDPFMEDGSILGAKPDIVAVTHGHSDHLGETVALNKKTVAITEIAKYLKTKGLLTESMNIGGTHVVDGVTFTMTQALHSTSIEEAGVGVSGGTAAGFVIHMDDVTVYHAGDTGLFSDMKLIGDLYHPDIAMLPIGGRFTMGVPEAMMAASFIGARTVIPIHYNTWNRIAADPLMFKKSLERTTDIVVKILSPGETIETGS
ncbi:metal-dependent hydrolase [uncultured Methanoregula sp.]|uniref:metal-dependent hydrolase n=1 Tax=uncultured Methanoregula sp. TaxID=1005933 RepID=UPI002AAAD3D9|nr:metal-dependent hydrolase [uncultured Methanoregula sp.]